MNIDSTLNESLISEFVEIATTPWASLKTREERLLRSLFGVLVHGEEEFISTLELLTLDENNNKSIVLDPLTGLPMYWLIEALTKEQFQRVKDLFPPYGFVVARGLDNLGIPEELRKYGYDLSSLEIVDILSGKVDSKILAKYGKIPSSKELNENLIRNDIAYLVQKSILEKLPETREKYKRSRIEIAMNSVKFTALINLGSYLLDEELVTYTSLLFLHGLYTLSEIYRNDVGRYVTLALTVAKYGIDKLFSPLEKTVERITEYVEKKTPEKLKTMVSSVWHSLQGLVPLKDSYLRVNLKEGKIFKIDKKRFEEKVEQCCKKLLENYDLPSCVNVSVVAEPFYKPNIFAMLYGGFSSNIASNLITSSVLTSPLPTIFDAFDVLKIPDGMFPVNSITTRNLNDLGGGLEFKVQVSPIVGYDGIESSCRKEFYGINYLVEILKETSKHFLRREDVELMTKYMVASLYRRVKA